MTRPFRRSIQLLMALLCALTVMPGHERSAAAVDPPPRKYFVSARDNCSNANSGATQAQCWKDLTKLNGVPLNPGDEIFLARGSVWDQELALTGNGKPGQPITISDYIDATGALALPAIIRNQDQATRGIRLTNAEYWTFKNLEIGKTGMGIFIRYPEHDTVADHYTYQGLVFENIYVHDIYGIYHGSGSGAADGIFNSAGIGILADGSNAGVARLQNVRLSNIHGTGNQDSIFIQGNIQGLGPSNSGPKSLIRDVTINNIYLHNDNAGQPTSPRNTFAWEFNSPGNLEGWNTPSAGLTASVPPQPVLQLNLAASATAPYLHSPNGLSIDPKVYRFLRLRLKNATSGTMAFVYFRRASDSYFNSANYIGVPIQPGTNTSGFTEYMVDLNTHPAWAPATDANPIVQLRLDLRKPEAAAGQIDVDFIRIDRVGWEFNSPGNKEGWGNPYPPATTSAVQSATSGVGALQINESGSSGSIDSPLGLNIDPNVYRYLRIGLKRSIPQSSATIYFAHPDGVYYPVTWTTAAVTTTTEYMVDMAKNPAWTSIATPINHLRLVLSNGQTDIDYIRPERRGCDDSLKLVGIRDFTLIDSILINGGACDSLTGTAAIFLGGIMNGTIVNSIIKNTPYFVGNGDMDAIDFEVYNDTVKVQNSYFANNSGPGINLLTRPPDCQPPLSYDYSINHELSGNLFADNGTGYTPAAGSIRAAQGFSCTNNSGITAPLPKGTIKTNIYRENGGLRSLATTQSSFADMTIPDTGPSWNLGVFSGYYAADGFSGTQLAGGWRYQDGLGGVFEDLTSYLADTQTWGRMYTTTTISRFAMQPNAAANAQVVRAWVVPASVVNRPISIRSRALISRPINPASQTAALTVTRTRGTAVTQIWSGTLNSSNWTAGLEQVSEVDVTANDVIRFIVTNTSPNPANVPMVSWSPAIGVR